MPTASFANWSISLVHSKRDAAGLAPGTIKIRYVNVRSVFRAAVDDKVIGSDPTDDVRLPPGVVGPTPRCRSPPWRRSGS